MKQSKKPGAVIYKEDGSMIPCYPREGKNFTCDEMHMIVGGYFQIVSDGKISIVMDEEGKLKGKRPNKLVTTIARELRLIHRSDYIVGDAILCDSSMV